MNITRNQLHQLVDMVDSNEMGLVCQLLLKFIPEVEPLPDEIEVMRKADVQIERGEVYDASEIDWDAE